MRRIAVVAASLVFCLLAGLVPSPLHAQWSGDGTMDLGMGFGQMALSQSAISGTRAIGEASGRAFRAGKKRTSQPPKATRQANSLTFRAKASVTRVVNKRFIDWQSKNHPELRPELARGIKSGELQGYFRHILDGYGYQANNIADVSSAYYISLWRIVHGTDPTPRQIAGVRRQTRSFMAEDRRLTGLPDEQKQEICETFALHTALALQGYKQLVESGDADLLRNFRRGLQATLAPQGPDLMEMEISDAGFATSH